MHLKTVLQFYQAMIIMTGFVPTIETYNILLSNIYESASYESTWILFELICRGIEDQQQQKDLIISMKIKGEVNVEKEAQSMRNVNLNLTGLLSKNRSYYKSITPNQQTMVTILRMFAKLSKKLLFTTSGCYETFF